MGYYTRYSLEIMPQPDLSAIQGMGRARRVLEREGLPLSPELIKFFEMPINEAIYQALFNDKMTFALGRGLAGNGNPDSQWHEHEEDMRKLSAAAGCYLFTLTGEGEESGDQWRKYFKGGKMQVARAHIQFDAFDESKLA